MGPKFLRRGALAGILALCALAPLLSCASGAASAEEYYSLGMAYFDQKKYAEAERWLNRARAVDRTRNASEYTLGRIAFERQDYEGALAHFEKILRLDPKNTTALKAAAYTLIRLGRMEGAEIYYGRLLELNPEGADNGYSYAVVLFALDKAAEAEELLGRYAAPLAGNRDALLLLARVRAAQGKVEAVDDYQAWLAGGADSRVRREYAEALERGGYYARAVEEYRALLQEAGAQSGRPELRFALGRLLLMADPEADGVAEIQAALDEGFSDTAALEALLEDPSVPAARREELRPVIRAKLDAPPPEEEASAEELPAEELPAGREN
jgi:tetratricopeptide (TPR) repeat protein